ncbi:hypothetical protein KYK30_06945 [Shinella yambaruensis]|uniref:Transmembrane protein n=1 Tax=Shinella yambaruensis TaxID=415996 RepID=A0ABQ5ZRX9_9HYPH|nr:MULTISPECIES: hypothetical protein [Shinella]MCJ8024967.1 hypothetical protein [Shinella yambaruensis]MCU7979420.1 hypothetical protein [Shinella yambaruensis]MCW5707822.1 hypothetical protein [Shinella sp.]GLR54484.1 hypothetical protein GCM10007923_57010 [Shinella yambaruensis]
MTSSARLAHHAVALAGGVLAVLAVGWWWLIFSKVVENDYLTVRQAVTCLAGASDLCTLAQALCTNDHLYGIRWYAPEAFWAAASILVAGAILSVRPSRA